MALTDVEKARRPDLAERLRAYLAEHQCSQNRMARIAGCHQASIAQFLKNHVGSNTLLAKIEVALRETPEYHEATALTASSKTTALPTVGLSPTQSHASRKTTDREVPGEVQEALAEKNGHAVRTTCTAHATSLATVTQSARSIAQHSLASREMEFFIDLGRLLERHGMSVGEMRAMLTA